MFAKTMPANPIPVVTYGQSCTYVQIYSSGQSAGPLSPILLAPPSKTIDGRLPAKALKLVAVMYGTSF